MNSGVLKVNICRILSILSSGFSVFLILTALYVIVCSYRETGQGKPFFLFGWKPVVVLSNSMEPTFTSGKIILIKEKEGSPEVNDIVMFRQNKFGLNEYVTHRIVGKDEGGYITKGDANNCEDPGRLQENDIFGTVKIILF
ncbi:signal peptidase, endoplasmic reticulum-type [Oribacterium sp. KHPX15]|uniref:signal peptidase I n=1 Tax=unclassified Oribacterium TaxID=2629782 RepID=UPI0006784606|nr:MULTISPECIES: signal peptidase I [unclassified Oribacterium]SEA47118.1 signal peptidase, endoplasmic reticulum-type [Oribacterium sp. KHPX15]